MNIQRFFKVKYGFGVTDQVSIEEKDIHKAIYAQVKGIPVQLGNAYINGRNIISITPDWHKHTGWYEWYTPTTGEDFAQIQRDCPNYECVIEAHKNIVFDLIQTNRTKLIEDGSSVLLMSDANVLQLRGGVEKRLSDGSVKSVAQLLK